MGEFTYKAVRELGAELLYSPREVRRRYARNLEILLAGFDAARAYPIDYLTFRITGFSPEIQGPAQPMRGEALRADLQRLLADVAAADPEPVAEQDEPILRLDEAAARCGVSVRTVQRWRREGLVARPFLFGDGDLYVGVRETELARFVALLGTRAQRSRDFSRLSAAERREIVERARALRAQGARGFSAVVRQVAAELGRARETVRYTLRAADLGEDGWFAPARRPLSEAEEDEILAAHRGGESLAVLARRLGRSASSVHAILRRAGYREVLAARVDFIDNPQFHRTGAFGAILGRAGLEFAADLPDAGVRPTQPRDELPDLSALPVLTREQEGDLFRRYNFIKYRARRVQERLRRRGGSARALAEFDRLRDAARRLRACLVRCNLRLVIGIARKHLGPLTSLAELTSLGNMALLRAVEKFDYSRGFKFSTYAGWAITKQFARSIPEENYRLATFLTGQDETLRAVHAEADLSVEEREYQRHLRDRIAVALERLDARERDIIRGRFGLGGAAPMTLEELGCGLGVTRERIRQIELAAMAKLRNFLDPQVAELLPA